MRLALPLVAVSLAAGCAHEVSSEDRLDRETNNVPLKQAPGAAELTKINCADSAVDLAKARDVNRNETDRVMGYLEVYEGLKKKTSTIQEAMTRNPDLAYREGAQEFVNARDVCVQQTADVRLEFEQYVRDLVEVPTVQEIKGGNTVTVARLDFNTLRQAIESLSPDDKEALVSRVNNAEKRVQQSQEGTETTTRRRR